MGRVEQRVALAAGGEQAAVIGVASRSGNGRSRRSRARGTWLPAGPSRNTAGRTVERAAPAPETVAAPVDRKRFGCQCGHTPIYARSNDSSRHDFLIGVAPIGDEHAARAVRDGKLAARLRRVPVAASRRRPKTPALRPDASSRRRQNRAAPDRECPAPPDRRRAPARRASSG